MAGYTNSSFRRCCSDLSADLTYTEMVSARGIIHNSSHTFQLLDTTWDKKKPFVHIYGNTPDIMAEAAKILTETGRFSGIDINCGCPARKITSKGYGSKLMHTPEKIYEIIKSIKTSTTLPVTVKTRIGISKHKLNYKEILHAVEDAGADAMTVHARTITDMHTGDVMMDKLAELKASAFIPIIGNGGISSQKNAHEMMQYTKVDAVMIGQAALGNPWIFSEKEMKPNLEQKKQMINTLIQMDIELLENFYKKNFPQKWTISAEEGAVIQFRSHIFRFLKGTPGWHPLKIEVSKVKSIKDLNKLLNKLTAEN